MSKGTQKQTAGDVTRVAKTIGDCDFRTGVYAYTTGEESSTWICFAAHGNMRRYFIISDANTDNPKITVLGKEQSRKTIDKVDATDIDYQLTLTELIADSFTGVYRLLGLEYVKTCIVHPDINNLRKQIASGK